MRFVIAVITLVVAALLVLLGLAQRTVFAPPSSVTSSVSTTKSDATLTVISAKALKGYAGREHIVISGSDQTIMAAYGRTSDIKGWVGDATYNSVTFDKTTGKLVTKKISGSETTVPNPHGSDLWYQEYRGSTLDFSLDAPSDISLIIATDGTHPAPSSISVTWPLSTATPLVGPLISAGLLVFLIGILLFVWAILHHRRLRGPRRSSGGGRGPKLPRSERPRSVRSGRRTALGIESGSKRRTRRIIAVVPVVVVASVALAGCSPDYWPQPASGDASSQATPTATATTAPGNQLQPPAITQTQATDIMQRVVSVENVADKYSSARVLGGRFEGPALAQRSAYYTIKKTDKTAAAPVTIPEGKLTLTLPQQTDTWPRTVFVVVQSSTSTTTAPVGVMLKQDSARDPYKVDYLVGLEAQAKLTNLPPASLGAARLAPDVKLLLVQPDALAADYADILKNADASDFAKYFDATGDTLRDKIGRPYKLAKAAKLPSTAKIAYTSAVGSEPSIALATNDAGAIVSVSLNEIETVTPTKAGAEVNTEGEVKSLSGVAKSTKGITATYGVQLLFSVPPVGSKDKVELLGFSQGLISAKEVSK
ncbi:hypothetical protein [Frondihabitans australicus]|uniref:DUF8094 domain-containing protein n=1 Tax=Frondihabitans australicus TaxID=386892 RepID=A0A495IDY9_9MICO|nr:hypothetical protein [Frondihabitans australicus]RKR73708.1 hypothetical protein C8E83_0803 [Frondihabitans australicus]